MRIAAASSWLAVAAGLCACSDMRVIKETPPGASVHYDGVVHTLEDATAAAQGICAAHGLTAQLRANTVKAAIKRIAHFDCVNG